MKLLVALLLIGVIAANGLLYMKLNALETRVALLQYQTSLTIFPYSGTPPPVSDPDQEAVLKEAAPLLAKARAAIQKADYAQAKSLLREAKGHLNEMKKSAGSHSTAAYDWLHHQIDDLHKQIAN